MDKLDLTQPITAHHRDGRVVTAIRHGNGNVSWESGGNHHCLFVIDGELQASLGGWTIRNTAKQGGWVLRDEYAAKPSTPSNEELTQRMEKLVRRIANPGSVDHNAPDYRSCVDEARSIVSDLPKPVDPIETRVTEIMREHEIAPDDTGVRAAIRFALAAGGTAHE